MQNLEVTLIQSPLFWEDKASNLAQFEDYFKSIEKSDLIVLPEMFNSGFTMNSQKVAEKQEGETLAWMQFWAKEKNTCICGSFVIEENENYYNRLFWVFPEGNFEHYNKRHLFRMANEHHFYTAGKERLIVHVKGWKICPLICYDLRFPVYSRRKNDYDCLIYVANWPAVRSGAWKTLLEARAIENQVYCIGVNRIGTDDNGIAYSGDSAVIDAKGVVLQQLKTNESGIIRCTLDWQDLNEFREKFPVHLDADSFEIK